MNAPNNMPHIARALVTTIFLAKPHAPSTSNHALATNSLLGTAIRIAATSPWKADPAYANACCRHAPSNDEHRSRTCPKIHSLPAIPSNIPHTHLTTTLALALSPRVASPSRTSQVQTPNPVHQIASHSVHR